MPVETDTQKKREMFMTKIVREYPNSFNLPKRIEGLARLAHNLWWSWNPDAQRLFRQIAPLLWDAINHNPIAFLHRVDRTRLNAAFNRPRFLEHYDAVMADMEAYLNRGDTWFATTHPKLKNKHIAYFSFEFGLHESLPVYAGGLGILSGDHLKEASDLGLPLTAIGFVYNQGYFVQHLTEDGWQETRSALINYNDLPLVSLLDENQQPVTIQISLPGREVTAASGSLRSDACAFTCSIPISKSTAPLTANSPKGSTTATPRYASLRRSCWASAVCAPSRFWGSSPMCGT